MRKLAELKTTIISVRVGRFDVSINKVIAETDKVKTIAKWLDRRGGKAGKIE